MSQELTETEQSLLREIADLDANIERLEAATKTESFGTLSPEDRDRFPPHIDGMKRTRKLLADRVWGMEHWPEVKEGV